MPTDATPTADRLARLMAVLQKALGHELPNQLIAVQGLARLLDLEHGERLGAEGRDYLGRLAAGAARAHALVAELADVARLARPAAPSEAVDFAEVAAEAVAEARQSAGRPAEYQEPGPTLVLAVPRAALRKLLVILMRRAAAGAEGRPAGVELSVRPCGAWAEVRVAGDGAPLPDDSFGGEDGRGLDLFLARQLAESWGGSLRAEARAPRGSAFVVTCPFASATDGGPGT